MYATACVCWTNSLFIPSAGVFFFFSTFNRGKYAKWEKKGKQIKEKKKVYCFVVLKPTLSKVFILVKMVEWTPNPSWLNWNRKRFFFLFRIKNGIFIFFFSLKIYFSVSFVKWFQRKVVDKFYLHHIESHSPRKADQSFIICKTHSIKLMDST